MDTSKKCLREKDSYDDLVYRTLVKVQHCSQRTYSDAYVDSVHTFSWEFSPRHARGN